MERKPPLNPEVTSDLLDAIRSFPIRREVEHRGVRFMVDAFDFHAACPGCGERLKVRSYSAQAEVEDVFDAVFEWMSQPEARELAERRRAALEDDE